MLVCNTITNLVNLLCDSLEVLFSKANLEYQVLFLVKAVITGLLAGISIALASQIFGNYLDFIIFCFKNGKNFGSSATTKNSDSKKTSFKTIPAEIRLKIFSYSEDLIQPQKFYTLAIGRYEWHQGLQIFYKHGPTLPIALSLCNESRHEALNTWVPFTARKVTITPVPDNKLFQLPEDEPINLITLGPQKVIYANPEVDMFLFGFLKGVNSKRKITLKEYLAKDVDDYKVVTTEDKKLQLGLRFDVFRPYDSAAHCESTFTQIINLGISLVIFTDPDYLELRPELVQCLRRFSNLKTLTIFLGEGTDSRRTSYQPEPETCIDPGLDPRFAEVRLEFETASSLIKRYFEHLLVQKDKTCDTLLPKIQVLLFPEFECPSRSESKLRWTNWYYCRMFNSMMERKFGGLLAQFVQELTAPEQSASDSESQGAAGS